jgi:GntR family transcriptional regulator, transcriptional repressor for pyruvate dehydrogenase complex
MTKRYVARNGEVFAKIRIERVADKVVGQLTKLIADGVFKVGERLPSEREIAERMSVSRISVREAMQKLKHQGIVKTVHGGGSVVRNITEQEIRRPIERLIDEDKTRVLELTELRAVMEPWAARQAAKSRTDAELETIEDYLEEMETDLERGRIRYEVDFKFHTEIGAATHNTIYLHLMDSIYSLIRYSIKVHHEELFADREGQRMILSHHRLILTAIRNQEAELAERAMREHLIFVVAEYTRHFFSGSQDRPLP